MLYLTKYFLLLLYLYNYYSIYLFRLFLFLFYDLRRPLFHHSPVAIWTILIVSVFTTQKRTVPQQIIIDWFRLQVLYFHRLYYSNHNPTNDCDYSHWIHSTTPTTRSITVLIPQPSVVHYELVLGKIPPSIVLYSTKRTTLGYVPRCLVVITIFCRRRISFADDLMHVFMSELINFCLSFIRGNLFYQRCPVCTNNCSSHFHNWSRIYIGIFYIFSILSSYGLFGMRLIRERIIYRNLRYRMYVTRFLFIYTHIPTNWQCIPPHSLLSCTLALPSPFLNFCSTNWNQNGKTHEKQWPPT